MVQSKDLFPEICLLEWRVAEMGVVKPMSFEPIAADMQIVMQSAAGNSDYYVGLSYAEGLGKVRCIVFVNWRLLIKRFHLLPPLTVQVNKSNHHCAEISR